MQMNAQIVVCKANMYIAYYVFSWDFYSDKNRLSISKKKKMALTFFKILT